LEKWKFNRLRISKKIVDTNNILGMVQLAISDVPATTINGYGELGCLRCRERRGRPGCNTFTGLGYLRSLLHFVHAEFHPDATDL
jgi:hypothetical protein